MKNEIDLTPILEKVGAFVKREAIRMCPVDMGDLRRSIQYKVEGNSVVIFSDLDYAEDMEYGTPPSPEGIFGQEAQDIKEWAERHNLNPWAVIKGIEKNGIKVGTVTNPLKSPNGTYRPFLRPAVYMNIPEIRKIIAESIK